MFVTLGVLDCKVDYVEPCFFSNRLIKKKNSLFHVTEYQLDGKHFPSGLQDGKETLEDKRTKGSEKGSKVNGIKEFLRGFLEITTTKYH